MLCLCVYVYIYIYIYIYICIIIYLVKLICVIILITLNKPVYQLCVCLFAAAEPERQVQVRHGEGQCGGDVLQAPGRAVHHVPHHGGQKRTRRLHRHRARQNRVSYTFIPTLGGGSSQCVCVSI